MSAGIPPVVAALHRVTITYAAAKAAMDGLANVGAEQRTLLRLLLDRQPDPADPKAAEDLASQVARSDVTRIDIDRQLAAAIATWRGAIFALQAAAVATVGVSRTQGCRRADARLQDAAQRFAEAKRDVDSHPPPFSGVAYAAKLANWRSCMMELDSAARAYAGGVKLAEGGTA